MYTSAFILLVMGMGTTFVFLYVMILCTKLNAKFVPRLAKFVPEPELKKAPVAKPAANDDEAVVAAIAAAMVKAQA